MNERSKKTVRFSQDVQIPEMYKAKDEKNMRRPGFEPGYTAWKAAVINSDPGFAC